MEDHDNTINTSLIFTSTTTVVVVGAVFYFALLILLEAHVGQTNFLGVRTYYSRLIIIIIIITQNCGKDGPVVV